MPIYKGKLIGKSVAYGERPILLGYYALPIPGTTTQTTINLNLICNDLKKDDLIIVMHGCGATAAATLTVDTAGYTTTHTSYQNGSSYDVNVVVAYKFMGDIADSTVVVSGTGSASYGGGVLIYAFRNVDKNKTFDVTSTTATSVTSMVVDPAAITPVTKNSLVLVMAAGGHGSTSIPWSGSPDLSSFISIAQSDTTDFTIGGGIYHWISGAFNPGAWTWTPAAGGAHFVVTMALKPRLDSAIWDLNSVYNAYR